jgi:hypothetical protein
VVVQTHDHLPGVDDEEDVGKIDAASTAAIARENDDAAASPPERDAISGHRKTRES